MVLDMLITAILLAVLGTAFAADKAKGGKFAAEALQTATGTVKNLVLPGNTSPDPVTFTIAGEKDAVSAQLGPAAFLAKLGLTLPNDKAVKATGWMTTEKGITSLQVRELFVDGKSYTFRDERGKPAWGEFIAYPSVTITGKVKDLTIPAQTTEPAPAAATPAAGTAAPAKPQKPAQIVSFTLVTDTESLPVRVAPVKGYAQLGLPLKDGDTVAVTGWKITAPEGKGKRRQAAKSHLVPQSITVGEKTYTLRAADGKAAWQQAAPRRAKNGGKNRQPK